MPIIVPKDIPAAKVLQSENIFIKDMHFQTLPRLDI